jgi:hypothetical protein
MTEGSLATPSGVRGGNSSKEKLSGEAMRGTSEEELEEQAQQPFGCIQSKTQANARSPNVFQPPFLNVHLARPGRRR